MDKLDSPWPIIFGFINNGACHTYLPEICCTILANIPDGSQILLMHSSTCFSKNIIGSQEHMFLISSFRIVQFSKTNFLYYPNIEVSTCLFSFWDNDLPSYWRYVKERILVYIATQNKKNIHRGDSRWKFDNQTCVCVLR